MGSLYLLGANWPEIIESRYIGSKPSISAHQGWEALCTLDRLLPHEIERFLSCGAKGPSAIGYLINLGITLKKCEGLVGFSKVWKNSSCNCLRCRSSKIKVEGAFLYC